MECTFTDLCYQNDCVGCLNRYLAEMEKACTALREQNRSYKLALREIADTVSEALLLDEQLADAWGDLETAMSKVNKLLKD